MAIVVRRGGWIKEARRALGRMLFSGFGSYDGAGFGWPWSWSLLPGARYDYEKEAGDLWRNSAVMATLGWLQSRFDEPELTVTVKSTQSGDGRRREPVEDHPLAMLVNDPNPYYTSTDLWQATVLSWVIDGNAYWMKARTAGGFGPPGELWWVNPYSIWPVWPKDGSEFISGYVLRVDGKDTFIRKEDVIHFRCGIDPHNERKGLSRLKATLREICGDNEAAGYGPQLLRNMGVPGLIISPASENAIIGPDEGPAIKAKFESHFTGENRGRPCVNSVPLKVDMPAFSPDQMALDKIVHRFEERITAVLGISPMVVGLGSGLERSTFTNYAEAQKAAWECTIVPTQRLMARQLRKQLLPDLGDVKRERVEWDYSQVTCVQEDMNAKAERWRGLYKDGLARRREGRADLGMDVTPEDNVFIHEVQHAQRMELMSARPQPAGAVAKE